MNERKELNDELKGSDVKKDYKVGDIKFIPDDGINGRYITFIGRKYTRNQFITMLQLMQKGLFLYPDELIKNEDNPDIETENVKGWVITRSLVPLSDLKDPRLIAITDDFDDVNDAFIKAVKFQKNKSFNFKALISDDFIDMISLFIQHNLTVDDFRLLPNVLINRWCQTVYEIPDRHMCGIKRLTITLLDVVNLDSKERYIRIIALINKIFNVIRHNHYCMICDTFSETKLIRYVERKKEDNRLLTDKTDLRKDDDVHHAYACSTCRTKLSNPRQATSTKINRNESCTCGSGKKYKRCCGK